MTERVRAIPLATLVCVVGVLAVVRVVGRSSARRATASRASADATSAEAGAPSIARAVIRSATTRDDGARAADADVQPDAGAPLLSSGPWRLLHEDPGHTHRVDAVGPTHATLGWTTSIGAPIEAQVVASPDERTLYVAALDGSLTALDAATGAKVWTVPLGDRAYSTPCVSPSGTIYVGSDAKRFFAVTPKGTVAWKLEVSGEADTGAVPVGDLVVFAAGASVFAVRSGGELAWRFDAKKKVFTAPAVLRPSSSSPTSKAAIVFGSQDHHVYALSSAGTLAWSTDLGADVDGAPAIADDATIAVGTDAGEVVRLAATGEVLWRAQVGGFVRGTLAIARNGDTLAGVYGPTPRVVRIGPNGEVRASFSIQGTGAREFGVHGAPLEDASGALFFGAQDDDVRALGPDGAWAWTFATHGDVDAPLTLLSSGALVAASDDGNVYLLRP